MRFSIVAVIFMFVGSGVLVYALGSEPFETCSHTTTSSRYYQQNESNPHVRPLTERYPSPETMNEYLIQFETRAIEMRTPYHAKRAHWNYVDVSGDGQNDLILKIHRFSDVSQLTILIWMGSYYCEPYSIGYSVGRGGNATYLLEDWTNDGIPEFVHKSFAASYSLYSLSARSSVLILTCESNRCRPVLSLPAYFVGWYAEGWDAHVNTTQVESTVLDNVPTLRTRSEGFSLSPLSQGSGLEVNPVIERTYQWNGTIFEQIEEHELVGSVKVPSAQVLSATNVSGVQATIEIEATERDASRPRTICHVTVSDQRMRLGAPLFGTQYCLPNFVQVEWRDVTGDGQEEILTRVISEYTPNAPCIYQILEILQYMEGEYVKVSQIAGCVVRSNLDGVRIADLDSDGQVEIIAAESIVDSAHFEDPNGIPFPIRMWERIYLFDGAQFSQPKSIPRQ